jgi:putative transposase
MFVYYKFRLYPTKEQEEKLLETLEICRQVYNFSLSQLNGKDKKPSKFELLNQIRKLKKEKPELNKVYARILDFVVFQLYTNLKTLRRLKKNGKKVGKLRFKGKGWYKTFIYNRQGFKLIKTGKRLDLLRLSKIGDIPIRLHREIDGKIKQIIIKKHNSGRWFAYFCVEKEVNIISREPKRVIGIDMGIKYFLTDSEGRQIESPKFCKKTIERIKILSRWLSKKIEGSKNYEKLKRKIAKLYERLINQGNDYLHKLSRFYVNNYDVICIENLDIEKMIKNNNQFPKILNAFWGRFFQLLEYKAENAGIQVIKVAPRGTSGGLDYKNPLRDWISAIRIRKRGWGSPETPAEMRGLLITVPAHLIVEAGNPLLG